MDAKIQYIIIAFLFAVGCCGCSASHDFALQSGDLLFSVGKENLEFTRAIQRSTSRDTEIPFSHVGIVEVDGKRVWVWEATTPKGVVKTSFRKFFQKALTQKGKTYLAVGRLKDEYKASINHVLAFVSQQQGKPYDYAYNEDNDAFYCSELVRFAFTDSLHQPIFPSLNMSFKNKESGKTEPFWLRHFQRLGIPVPEGMPGSNPADMAKSSVIDVIYTYY